MCTIWVYYFDFIIEPTLEAPPNVRDPLTEMMAEHGLVQQSIDTTQIITSTQYSDGLRARALYDYQAGKFIREKVFFLINNNSTKFFIYEITLFLCTIFIFHGVDCRNCKKLTQMVRIIIILTFYQNNILKDYMVKEY